MVCRVVTNDQFHRFILVRQLKHLTKETAMMNM